MKIIEMICEENDGNLWKLMGDDGNLMKKYRKL